MTVSYTIPNPPSNPAEPFFGFQYIVPDYTAVSVFVADRDTNEPIGGCPISVFNIDSPSNESNISIASGTTDARGSFWFPWGNGNLHSNFNLARVIKVSRPGYAPIGQWISVFDMQAWFYTPHGGDDGDFHYHGSVELRPGRL